MNRKMYRFIALILCLIIWTSQSGFAFVSDPGTDAQSAVSAAGDDPVTADTYDAVDKDEDPDHDPESEPAEESGSGFDEVHEEESPDNEGSASDIGYDSDHGREYVSETETAVYEGSYTGPAADTEDDGAAEESSDDEDDVQGPDDHTDEDSLHTEKETGSGLGSGMFESDGDEVSDADDEGSENDDAELFNEDGLDMKETEDICEEHDAPIMDENRGESEDAGEAADIPEAEYDKSADDAGSIPEAVRGLDLSSGRLLVGGPKMIIDEEAVIFTDDDLYLMQFSSEEEARQAYVFYMDNAEYVDIDGTVAAADGSPESIEEIAMSGSDILMTPEDNPFALMQDAVGTDAADTTKSLPASSGSDKSLVIALLDTGASEGRNIEARYSVVSDHVYDDNGHGDKMAEIMTGINPDVKIISVKVLDENGVGTVSSVYAGMKLAIAEGADIINMSFYGLKNNEAASLQEIASEASDRGIILTGAAGNSGRNAAHYYPGCIKDAVIAGSLDEDGHLRAFSNYGDNVDYYAVSDSTSEAAAIVGACLSTGESEKELLGKGRFFLRPDDEAFTDKTDKETDMTSGAFFAATTAGTTTFGEAIPFKYGVGYFTRRSEANTEYGNYISSLPWQNLVSSAGASDYYRMKIGEIFSRQEAVSRGSWFKWKNNGFVFKDDKTVPIDTKVYIWAENTQYGYGLRDIGYIGQPQSSLELPYSQRDDADIMLEFHFYEAGTDREMSDVCGFMWLCDLDYKDSENVRSREWREGYTIVRGAKKYYTSQNSDLITMPDEDGSTAFYGTQETTDDNIDSTLGVCFESSPSAPLLVRYHARALYWQCFGDDGRVKIRYHLQNIPEGMTADALLPNTRNLIINTRTNVSEADFYWDHKDVPDYTFKGWYVKSDLTGSPYKGTDKMTADVDLYGTYIPHQGKISLTKSIDERSGYDFIKENKCYSLAGAEYGIYSSKADAKSDRNRLDTLRTDASGKTSASKDLDHGTYYVREMTASPGFYLCRGGSGDDADTDGIHTVKTKPGSTVNLVCKETPAAFSPSFTLRKLDAVTGSAEVSGAGSLKDAVFELDYYDNIKGETEGTPAVSRTYRTGEKGELKIEEKAMPLGTYVLKETVPSRYYKADGEICFEGDKVRSDIKEGLVFTAAVTEKDNTVEIKSKEVSTADMELTIEAYEQPHTGKVTVIKKDGGTDEALSGIIFRLKSEDGKLSYEKTTGSDGICEFDGLPTGSYILTEIASDKKHQLLKDSIDITLPIEMSEKEIDENKADKEKAVWDENTKLYCFYEQTVTVSNGVDFEVPMTGGTDRPLMAGAAIAVLMMTVGLAYLRKVFVS